MRDAAAATAGKAELLLLVTAAGIDPAAEC
jgi:hypothetical protein